MVGVGCIAECRHEPRRGEVPACAEPLTLGRGGAGRSDRRMRALSAVAGVAADGAGGRRNHPSPTVLSFVSPNAIAVVSMTYARTPSRIHACTWTHARTHARTHAHAQPFEYTYLGAPVYPPSVCMRAERVWDCLRCTENTSSRNDKIFVGDTWQWPNPCPRAQRPRSWSVRVRARVRVRA